MAFRVGLHLADLGSTPLAESPGDFGKLIAGEINKWAKVNPVRKHKGGVNVRTH
jgi:hypothetical protein